ncbi:MAG: sugar phosphate nucleotidyltransferase [Anaerolineae bacterium]
MKAVVMAGGEGSRLRPLTIGRPKPMVPVANKPIIAHILDLLRRHGITEVVVTLQYMAETIQDFLGTGQHWGMNIHYSVEEVPLGTAGSVKNAQQYLDETFIIISGDALTDFDLEAILNYHRQKRALATITLYRVPNPLEYGVVITDEEGHIRQFLEKPSWSEVISDTVNTGIYVLEPEVLDYIPAGTAYDFSKDLFPIMLERNDPLYGYVAEGYWCDIGNIPEYMRATADLLSGRVKVDSIGEHIGGGIWVEPGVEIAPDAKLYGPVYLGHEVKIKGGVIIHGPTAIRDYSIIDNRAHIDRCIIWRNSYIGEACELRGTIVGRQCNIHTRTMTFEGAVIGDRTIVGRNAVIHANVKIWPEKEIEAGVNIYSSVIWGAQSRRTLFGRFGVTGMVNIDLTPEFAAKLGAAFGATLPKGSTVTINRDPHRSPRMLKRATISGLPSAGINVLDLRTMPIPVACYYTRTSDAVGGVHLRVSPFDQRVVDIRFMDKDGLNQPKSVERNIERVFFREDFRRVYLDDIGTISYAPGVVERYTEGFLKVVNVPAIRERRFRIVCDYAYSPVTFVMPNILNQLRVDTIPLNAHIDETKMAIGQDEFEKALWEMALITGALSADLGVRFDVGGEKLFIADNRGKILPNGVALVAMAVLAWETIGPGAVVVPVHQSHVLERLAARYGATVRRTKTDLPTLTRAALEEGVIMAGDGTGNFIFPAFQPAADGMMATAKLLEFLAVQKTSLSRIVDSLPAFHIARGHAECPWELKGTVMRKLNEQYKDYGADMTDGIKIYFSEEQWVLVLPDPDTPEFHIYAEASSMENARELVHKYERIIAGLQE